jgi:hypothetical protein
MKEIDPAIIIMATEPVVNIVPPANAAGHEMAAAAQANEDQFQATDILTGRMCPELGGKPEYLDILGLNYYYNNQWEIGYRHLLPWANIPFDDRWLPPGDILLNAYNRYECPFILSETSHPGEHRPNWITGIGRCCVDLLNSGLPFWGVCLYPVIDRPDWDDLTIWHHSGLWDEEMDGDGSFKRILNTDYAQALLDAQSAVKRTAARTSLIYM